MAHRVYFPPLSQLGERLLIDGDEAHHLLRVIRVRRGQSVEVFDGVGTCCQATLVEASRGLATLERVGSLIHRPAPPPRTLLCPLPKGKRLAWLVEKLVELGTTTLVPLLTARSVTDPATEKGDRLRQWVIAACKQSGRDWLMTIQPPQQWAAVLESPVPPAAWMLDPGGSRLRPPIAPTTVAIGPEGGWTDDERISAERQGWRLQSLGPSVLRVETAAMIACSNG